MTLEAILASAHVVAILALVTFMSSQAALCRIEWMNAAVVERLVRLDVIYQISMATLVVSGLVRILWGIKGASWYLSQPMLHAKLTLLLVMIVLSVPPTLAFRRWRSALRTSGALPAEVEVRKARKLIMVQSHLLPVVAVIAVFWARGW